MKIFIKLSLSLIALIGTTVALAGSDAGHGIDFHDPYRNNAWFAGPENSIRACIKASSTFGVEETDLRKEIQAAFQLWTDYLKTKHLNDPKGYWYVPLAHQLEFNEKCAGNEDLTFYFGVSDELIQKFLKNYSDPVAFSEKTAYDPKTGWGKGVIWVSAPRKVQTYYTLDWKRPHYLLTALAHELGHVMGVEHMPDTVMDSEMGYRLIESGGPSGSALNVPIGAIDGRAEEVVSCKDCLYQFKEAGHAQLQSRFEKLTKRKPVGNVAAVLELKEGFGQKTGTLRLIDSQGEETFSLKVQKEILWRNGNQRAFKCIFNGQTREGIPNGRGVLYGELWSEKIRVPISLSRNLSYTAEIVDLDGPVPNNKEDDSDFFHGHTFKILDPNN